MTFETLFDLQTVGYRPPEGPLGVLLFGVPMLAAMIHFARVLCPDSPSLRAAPILGGAFAILMFIVATSTLLQNWQADREIREAFSRNLHNVREGPATVTTTRTAKNIVRTRLKVDGGSFQFGERADEQGLSEADLRRLRLTDGQYVRITHYGPTILRLERRRP